MKAIILFGHGARDARWREPFDRLATLWRAVNILYASKQNTQPFWTQTWNIATCIVIYISSLIIYPS